METQETKEKNLGGRPRTLDVKRINITIEKPINDLIDTYLWENRMKNKSEWLRELAKQELIKQGYLSEDGEVLK